MASSGRSVSRGALHLVSGIAAVALMLAAAASSLAIEHGRRDGAALPGDACLDEGFTGSTLALCQVHCEVLACPEGGPSRACERSALLFERRTGRPPPCMSAAYDADGDGVADDVDVCPLDANADQADADGDGVGDVCDSCPAHPNPGQEDTFGAEGVGDVCDCPCFTRDDAFAIATDPLCAPICIESRPTSLELTALQCAPDRPDDSVLVATFTDFNAPLCQWNVPEPGASLLVSDLLPGQVEACRSAIRNAASDAGLVCR